MIELGAMLIDEAHACLATVEEQFTLTLPAEHVGYEALLDLFDSELAAQSELALRDIRENDLSGWQPHHHIREARCTAQRAQYVRDIGRTRERLHRPGGSCDPAEGARIALGRIHPAMERAAHVRA